MSTDLQSPELQVNLEVENQESKLQVYSHWREPHNYIPISVESHIKISRFFCDQQRIKNLKTLFNIVEARIKKKLNYAVCVV